MFQAGFRRLLKLLTGVQPSSFQRVQSPLLKTYSSFSDSVVATEIRLLKQKKALEITFSDGTKFSYPAELLRVESPSAADLRLRRQDPLKVVQGRRHIGILGVEPIGNYAVRVSFDDLHNSGLFSWEYLQELGRNKRARIRTYLSRLKQQGLSRDPPGRRQAPTK